MKTIESERLLFRPFKTTDLEDFYEYAKNPDVGPNAGWKAHGSIEESRSILERFVASDDVWALVLKETGKVIGSFGLHADKKRSGVASRMIGYVLSKDHWGKGLMTEAVKRVLNFAFDDLGLEIVSVNHFPFNHRSRRVIEKCGFTCEGTLRHAVQLPDGSITDDVCWSMTADEYRSLK